MDLAMQSVSDDQTVRNDAVQDFKHFKSQSLATQAKKRRTTGFYDASYLKSFPFNGR